MFLRLRAEPANRASRAVRRTNAVGFFTLAVRRICQLATFARHFPALGKCPVNLGAWLLTSEWRDPGTKRLLSVARREP
jgi:hypothetical protein